MDILYFERMEQYGVEQLVFCHDQKSGLKAIIAIHDTTLGPALGGTRMYPYATEEAAVHDVIRLARGMTYKSSAAGLNLGGGKAVIIGDPMTDKSEELFHAFGRFIGTLNGRYITAEDVGTTVADMDFIRQKTKFVTGVSPEFGSGGNPSPFTALGVFHAIRAASLEAFGSTDLKGKTIAVQGVGSVAYHLCRYLSEAGAKLIVTDVVQANAERAELEFGAKTVGVDDIYSVECDIFAPCAMGGIINEDTLPLLKAKVVAGAANNQLKEEKHGDQLAAQGILYAPDYVVNSGGLINVADEWFGYNRERVLSRVEGIYSQLQRIFELSKEQQIPSFRAADRLAEMRIDKHRA